MFSICRPWRGDAFSPRVLCFRSGCSSSQWPDAIEQDRKGPYPRKVPELAALSLSSHLHGSDGEASACNVGDLGSIPELGRSPGEGNGNPFQYSCLENPMDRGAWQATIHGVAKSRTQLRDFTFFHFGHQKCPHVLGIQNNPCGQTVLQLP